MSGGRCAGLVRGLLETNVGLIANLALASLPNFALPGDISASRRYYHEDVVLPDFELNPDSTVSGPQAPGLGVNVVRARLAAEQQIKLSAWQCRQYLQALGGHLSEHLVQPAASAGPAAGGAGPALAQADIALKFLPSYSPLLNDIERTCRTCKHESLAQGFCADRADLARGVNQ